MRNADPRMIQIVGAQDTWTDQIRAAWNDLLIVDEPTAFTMPTPTPSRSPSEQFIALDIIISQGLQYPRYSGLVSVHRIDEDDGLAQYTIAASFGSQVSGIQIVDAALAHSVCDTSSGRACSIFFGWDLIPVDHHPGHRMRPGNSFMIQVPRDPHLASGQPAASAATSSAVIAHGLPDGQVEQHHDFRPPGDDPEHPDDHPPSTPSSWHPGGSAGPIFNCHIYRLRHPPLHLFLRNAGGVPMLTELARHLQVVPASLMQSHAVHVQMVGESRTTWSYIVQSIADLPSASSDALVIIDVELHFHPLPGPVQPLPASTRRVCRVPQYLTRVALLRYAGVSLYCQQQHDRCLVQFNNVAWPLSHRGPQLVRHGVYLRVTVPPPDDGSNTLQAVHVVEQSASSTVTLSAPAPAPGTGPPSTPAPAPPPADVGRGVFRPNFNPAPQNNIWHQGLQEVYDEHAVVEFADEGPTLYVWTWMINHGSHTLCECPRIVRLDQFDHLWLHDLYEPWRDELQPDAPTDLRIIHPRPPHASTALDTVHVMIEQNPSATKAAGVISARFHGHLEDRLHQSAHSLPRWLCVEDIIDLLHINHICEAQRCTAHAGVAHFERFIRHDIPSGISIELHVKPALCEGDGGAASSHEHYTPRRTMPVAARSLLQRALQHQRAHVLYEEETSPSGAPISLDKLLDKPQYTFIDCQRPLFLRNQILQSSPVSVDVEWQHIWWHPATYRALWNTPAFVGEAIQGVAFYVDGSALRHSSHGAASAVLLTHTDCGVRWGGFATAPCLGNSTAPRAEATALLLALCWIHQLLNELPSHAWIEIVFDCAHTAAIAQGLQEARHNRDLHIAIRALVQWLEVRLQRPLHWRHVFGHCHDPWNEAADTLCRQALQWNWFTSSLQVFFDTCNFDASDNYSIQWLWMLEHSLTGSALGPELQDHWWRINVTAPFRHAPNADLHPAVRRCQDFEEEPVTKSASIRVASANVLTLFPAQNHASGFLGARAEDLAQQLNDAGIHFAGLQETRARLNGHTTLDGYHILSSPATSRGQGGVQLWIRQTVPTRHGPIRLRDQDLQILHATSRRLVVRCAYPGLRLLFLVVHAPCEESEDELQRFWDATTNAIPALYRSWTMVVMMDANSRVGSLSSAAIGPHQADEENIKGSFLHHWLLHHGLYLPQTFAECHDGDGSTWIHPKGASARIDYVAVSSNVLPDQVRTWISTDVDLTLNRDDHACVCADLQLEVYIADRRPRGERLSPIHVEPWHLSWASDVHTHAASLQAWMQQHPLPRNQWRKKHMSESTKILICAKKFHWKRLLDIRRHQRRGLLRCLFDAWRCNEGCPTDLRPWIVTCDRLLAWHRWTYDDLACRVVSAVREDDREFYDSLAAMAGEAADHSPNALWAAIQPVLPRWRHKRRSNLRCVGPSLPDQFRHYDALEAGHAVEYSDLLQDCHAVQQATLPDLPLQIDLKDLPSRLDIEALGSKIHVRRAAGIDGVAPHILQQACHHDSSWMHQLFFKMWVLGVEPLQGKGGLLHAIGKKEASHRIEAMRGIMLIDGIAKLAHAFLRGQFLPTLHKLRHPLQLGGFARSSTMFATAYVRSFVQISSSRTLSSAVLFIDIRSAFHAMIREVVLGGSESLHPALMTLLQQDDVDLDRLRQHCQQAPDLEHLGLPPCAARLLRDAHRHTWYTLGASDQVHQTERGSRPGSPLADVAFNGLMSLVLHELQERLQSRQPLQTAFASLGMQAFPVAWVDDLAVPVVSLEASQLIPEVQWVLNTTIQICRSYGLQLNLKPKKTEVVPGRPSGSPTLAD